MNNYYLVIEDSGEFNFYPHTSEGSNRMVSLFNNNNNRFFEITINSEFVIKYSAKKTKIKELPSPFFDNEDEDDE